MDEASVSDHLNNLRGKIVLFNRLCQAFDLFYNISFAVKKRFWRFWPRKVHSVINSHLNHLLDCQKGLKRAPQPLSSLHYKPRYPVESLDCLLFPLEATRACFFRLDYIT